MNNLLTDADQT